MSQTNRTAILALLMLTVLAVVVRLFLTDTYHLERYARKIEREIQRRAGQAEALVADLAFSPRLQPSLRLLETDWGLRSFNVAWYQGDSLIFPLSNLFLQDIPPSSFRARDTIISDHSLFCLGRVFPTGTPGVNAVAWIPVWSGREDPRGLMDPGFWGAAGIPDNVRPDLSYGWPTVKDAGGNPLFSLDVEGPVRDATEEGLMWCIFLGIALILVYFINRGATQVARRRSPWRGAALLLGILLVLRWALTSGGVPVISEFLPHPPEVFQTVILQQTLGGLLFNALLLFWVMIFFHREFQDLRFPEMSMPASILTATVNYLSIIIGIVLVAQTIRNLALYSGLNLYFDNIFEIEPGSIWGIAILILLFLAFFLFSHRMINAIFSLGLSTAQRVVAFVIAVAIAAPLYFWARIPFSPEGFLFATVVYIWMMDIFSEAERPNLTWMIVWLGIISGFSAILLSSFRLEKEDQIQRDIALRLGGGDTALLEEYLAEQELAGLQGLAMGLSAAGGSNILRPEDLEYALYSGGVLRKQTPNSLFPPRTPPSPQWKQGEPVRVTSSSGRVEWHVENEKGERIVVRRTVGNIMGPFSVFSYLFALFILVMPLLALANHWLDFLPPSLNFIPSRRPNLSNRIQLWTVSFLVVSFLLIGFFSVWNFRQSADFNQTRLVKSRLDAIRAEAAAQLDNRPDTIGGPELFGLLQELSQFHKTGLLIYDTLGRLQATTLPGEMVQPLFGEQMSGPARYLLTTGNAPVNLQRKQWGDLQLQTAYLPVRNAAGSLSAFIGLPFFDQPTSWQSELSDFISTLITAYVFLLFFAGSFAIFIANSITQPISQLGESLRTIKLGEKNKPLKYEREDEVGSLIQEYNQMLVQLEDSTQKLARSERDSAWREMAKQVGHEIKNPLTPITLTIQKLPLALQLKPEKTADTVKQTVSVVMEQVEILKGISEAFSQFAKMPDPVNKTFQINELVQNVFTLFRNEKPDFDFQLHLPDSALYIHADKNQMTRVLNNLLKNAIQAITDDRQGRITTRLSRRDDLVVIEVRDNGSGIPEKMWEKIFVPNFTTKSSGTGLGLAMTKDIVELAKGQIYFETELDKGTSFFVELPLVEAPEEA